jgi:formylglycine-generating enzyme required for sulfatase activity
MQRISTGLASAALALLASRCGGEVNPPANPPPDAAVFPADAGGSPSSALDPILEVPAGLAVEGYWYLDTSSQSIRPEDRCVDGLTKRLWVSAFRMMKLEVTAAMYKPCVDSGACAPPDGPTEPGQPSWDSPARQNQPVVVSFGLARTFCQNNGGDLPSEAEWDRAAAGDSLDSFGIASVTAQWLGCRFGQGQTNCDALAAENRLPNGATPHDVGIVAWDVGPFGHVDLFGNAEEWVRTATLQPTDADFCALADGSPDPVSVAPLVSEAQAVRQLAEELKSPTAPPWVLDTQGRPMYGPFVYKESQPAFMTGFRCAFPAE